MQITPTASGSNLTTASGTVTVGTNNATGYTLYMGIDNDATNALINKVDSNYHIDTLSSETTSSNFPNNKWGYSIDSPNSLTNFKPIPLVGFTDTLKTTTSPASTSTTDFSIATKANTELASGQYTNKVKFTAVTNAEPQPVAKAILGNNGNLNFVYDTNTYHEGDTYTDNLGETTIKNVYDVPYNVQSKEEKPAWTGMNGDSPEYRSDITSANFTDGFYYYMPASTAYWFMCNGYIHSITNLRNLNTSDVVNMRSMFFQTGFNIQTNFSLDVGSFDVHKVSDMRYMFQDTGSSAQTFSIDGLKNWFLGSPMINDMFVNCGAHTRNFFLDLSNWDVSRVTSLHSLFNGAGQYSEHFELNLTGWHTNQVTNMVYTFAYAGAESTEWRIKGVSDFNVSQVTNMMYAFFKAGSKANDVQIDLSDWDTSKVTDMEYLFNQFGSQASIWSVGDLSNWNTAKVTNMAAMFGEAGRSTSSWSVGNLKNWNTSNVTNMSAMFGWTGLTDHNGQNVTLDLTNWDTSKVTTMRYMFDEHRASAPNWSIGNISQWNTSNVTDMSFMFRQSGGTIPNFELDLSGWNTSKVNDMSHMFELYLPYHNRYVIDVGFEWDTSAVVSSQDMFANNTALVGGAGTTWSTSNPTDKTYARIDNPSAGQPGYFTRKGSNPDPVNPDTPTNNTTNNYTNINNTTNNTYNTTNSGNGDGEQSTDGYADPQGVQDSSDNTIASNQPNWFIIIVLSVLALGLLGIAIYFFIQYRKLRR